MRAATWFVSRLISPFASLARNSPRHSLHICGELVAQFNYVAETDLFCHIVELCNQPPTKVHVLAHLAGLDDRAFDARRDHLRGDGGAPARRQVVLTTFLMVITCLSDLAAEIY